MRKVIANYSFKSFFVLVIYVTSFGKADAQDPIHRHALQLTAGYSLHGSGDMKGIGAGAEYIRYSSKKLFLNYNLRSTINNQKHEIIINNISAGTTQDASIRFTTAGIQLGVDAGFDFIKSKVLNSSISLGGFVRYQSASNGTDGYSLYGPAATGLPTILVEYSNKTPQETVAFGGLLQLQFNVNVSRQWYMGLVPRFQTDTNGDAIVLLGLSVGRRF